MRRFSPFRFAPQGSSGSSFHGFSALRGLSGAWNRSRPTLSGLQSARTGSVLPDSTLFPLELIPEKPSIRSSGFGWPRSMVSRLWSVARTFWGLKRVETDPKWVAKRSNGSCPPRFHSRRRQLILVALLEIFTQAGASTSNISAMTVGVGPQELF